MVRTKFSELRDLVVAKPGARERLNALRCTTIHEIKRHESSQVVATTDQPQADPR